MSGTQADETPRQRSIAKARKRREAVLDAVKRSAEVASVQALLDAGHSRRTIDGLCASGELIRLRKGWVATPTVDTQLRAAATQGVVLTCVTQAQRLGLWVLTDEDDLHVASPPHAGRATRPGTRVHWATPLVPRPPSAVIDSIENVLCVVATCQPYERALAIWESAFRKQLIVRQAMARYALPPAARRILAAADIWSDSGLETFVVPRLRWMRLPLRRQQWIAGHHVDLLIGDRLVLQIDGGHHVGLQRTSDIEHDARLRLLGYHVIRLSYVQIVHHWPDVQDLIMRTVAQGLHLDASHT